MEAKTIAMGLDFGSLKYRAAYMLDGVVIPVPTPASEVTWVGSIMLQPTRDGGITFSSLKYELGTGQPMTFRGVKETVEDVVRDHFVEIKRSVEEYAGAEIGHTVISVPSGYAAFRRSETLDIAKSAGLGQVTLINDCAAAALDYTAELGDKALTLLVYSMGFIGAEVSLLRVAKGRMREMAHESASAPSGRDFDVLVMASCVDYFKRRGTPLPTKTYMNHWFDFRAIAAEAKHQLLVSEEAQLTLPTYMTNTEEPQTVILRRADFEQALQPDVETTLDWIDRLLEEANLRSTDVDKVLLVGGSTRIAYIQQQLEAKFGPKLIQPRDEILAKGAALQAARLAENGSGADQITVIPTVATSQSESRGMPVDRPEKPQPSLDPIFGYVQELIAKGETQKVKALLEEITRRVESAHEVLNQQTPK